MDESIFKKLTKEKTRLMARLKEIEHEEQTSMIAWLQEKYNGKIVHSGPKSNIIKIQKVWGFMRAEYGTHMSVSGEILDYTIDNLGFDSIKCRRILKNYPNPDAKIYTIFLYDDGSVAQRDVRLIDEKEWAQEKENSERLESLLLDKTGKAVRNGCEVAYVKDGKIEKHKICGFNPDNGLFTIRCREDAGDDGKKFTSYDYRLGSELIVI